MIVPLALLFDELLPDANRLEIHTQIVGTFVVRGAQMVHAVNSFTIAFTLIWS